MLYLINKHYIVVVIKYYSIISGSKSFEIPIFYLKDFNVKFAQRIFTVFLYGF